VNPGDCHLTRFFGANTLSPPGVGTIIEDGATGPRFPSRPRVRVGLKSLFHLSMT